MVDKSIENSNYPPFMTLVRGQKCDVWGIFERQGYYQLLADIEMVNQGYLNQVQQTNLTVKYLKGFANMMKYEEEIGSYKFFNFGQGSILPDEP